MISRFLNRFSIDGRICVVTGGGGLIGLKHAEAIVEGGGIPVLVDISEEGLSRVSESLAVSYGDSVHPDCVRADITDRAQMESLREILVEKYGHVDVLINNAANNPKVEDGSANLATRKFQDFPVEMWEEDLAVGLTGALVCSQVFGDQMERQGKGNILNISSDYGIIAPDQRVYKKDGLADEEQIIKPVSYSVVKHGIIGLTKYLAVYWAKRGVRVNTLCPASLSNGQDPEFVRKLSKLIPMGRMSDPDEYVCTVLYLISDASSYMTGSTVIVDGGRTSW